MKLNEEDIVKKKALYLATAIQGARFEVYGAKDLSLTVRELAKIIEIVFTTKDKFVIDKLTAYHIELIEQEKLDWK